MRNLSCRFHCCFATISDNYTKCWLFPSTPPKCRWYLCKNDSLTTCKGFFKLKENGSRIYSALQNIIYYILQVIDHRLLFSYRKTQFQVHLAKYTLSVLLFSDKKTNSSCILPNTYCQCYCFPIRRKIPVAFCQTHTVNVHGHC